MDPSVHGSQKRVGMPAAQLASAVTYGTVAVAANFIDKQAMQELPLPFSVLLMQLVGSLLIILPLHGAGIVKLPPPSYSRLRSIAPVAAAYGAHAALVLCSLATLNIPMYSTIKRTAPVFVLLTQAILHWKRPGLQMTAAVLLIVSGCIVAGIGDLAFDAVGYALTVACAIMQATYIVLAERLGHSSEPFDAAEILFYSSAMCTPVAGAVFALTESSQLGPRVTRLAVHWGVTRVAAWLGVVSSIECLLTGSLIVCSQLNSALTSSIIGVLKGVVAVTLGFFLLGGAPFSALNVLGIALNVLGGVWYSTIRCYPAGVI